MPRPHRPATMRAATVLLTTGLALTACTGTTTPPTSASSSTTKATVADPNAVLNQLATELRTQIDTLTTGVTTTDRGITGNEAAACRLPHRGDWPKVWTYAQRLFLTQPDSRPTARQLAEHLRGQGWTVRTHLETATDLELTSQKDGAVIDINAASTGGGMAIVGTSACVDSDGTVDHSPVP